MTTKIYRSTIKCGSIMSGYYRYLNVFQILESQKGSILEGKYLEIEYKEFHGKTIVGSKKKKPPASEFAAQRERERAHLNFLKELTALISIVTNQPCEIYYKKEMQILPEDQDEILQFSDISKRLKIRQDPNRVLQQQNNTLSFVAIHPQADVFFDNYFKLDGIARERYNASIFLYQGMRKILLSSASMAIIGLISSIENLMEFEGKKNGLVNKICENCHSPIYKIAARFKNFMLQYSEFEVDDKNKLLNKFYTRRSKISHAGAIMEIDRLISKFSMQEYREFTEIETHVRIALFNYLLKYDFSCNPAPKQPAV